MIIAKIQGGLGNQMFQYAMAKNVAIRNDTELKLDLSWFDNSGSNTRRIFDLEKFNIEKKVASYDEIFQLLKVRKRLGRDLYDVLVPFNRKKYIRLKEFSPFEKRYRTINSDAYIEGYWTDERYFVDIAAIVQQEFTLRCQLIPKNQDIASMLQEPINSVSLHVRRGDYVDDENNRKTFHICNEIYYERAIEKIKRRIESPCFFIFSDDIEWVKANIHTGSTTYHVSASGENFPCEELILMSMCRHNIIANSTFSWWGAWLNAHTEKIVIAPDRWYNLKSNNGEECIPSNWCKVCVV